MDEARLVTLPAVAEALGISTRELQRLRASGRFGPHLIRLTERLIRVRSDELRDWIDAACPPATRWRWTGGRA